ncbi:hypothetical protein GEMRC1_003424 [Eukaryota sp. GEM-RC1]
MGLENSRWKGLGGWWRRLDKHRDTSCPGLLFNAQYFRSNDGESLLLNNIMMAVYVSDISLEGAISGRIKMSQSLYFEAETSYLIVTKIFFISEVTPEFTYGFA